MSQIHNYCCPTYRFDLAQIDFTHQSKTARGQNDKKSRTMNDRTDWVTLGSNKPNKILIHRH